MAENDAKRYAETKRLFGELIGADEATRSARLAELRSVDGELADELSTLLDAALASVEAAQADIGALPAPEGYRIIRELGRGGMGIVFLAERSPDGVTQRVALKWLRFAQLANAADRARFATERRILAALDHPGIARLLDAGTGADGVPFLAMEWVDGLPIDRYCEAHALDTDERVRLLVRVCRAVDAAHRQLIVHRDLKPANILVRADGLPKLLDFGVAKLLEGDGGDSGDSPSTRTGESYLTVRYAAPEQLRGEPVSAATDVYALGVIAFELLTGHSPYGSEPDHPSAIAAAVVGMDPPLPSRAATASGGAEPRAARQLRGDLDAIVLQALRKKPQQRYAGTDRLADDFEAWLHGKPVAARRGSRGYRLRRFAWRWRWPLTMAAAIALLSVVFVARLVVELRRVDIERAHAELALAQSRATTRFLVRAFGEADPREARGTIPTVRAALDRGAARLAVDLADAPAVRSELAGALADIYREIGASEQAVELADRAVADALAVGDPLAVNDRRLIRARVLVEAARLDDAEAEASAARAEAQRRGDAAQVLEADERLAQIEHQRGNELAAQALYEQIETGFVGLAGLENASAATSVAIDKNNRDLLERLAMNLHNQCNSLTETGALAEARARCDAAAVLKERLWPADHPVQMSTALALARLAALEGDEAGSLAANLALAETAEDIYGPDHATLGIILLNAAVDLRNLGAPKQARVMLERAASIFEKASGRSHRGYLMARNNLANLLIHEGEPETARAIHDEVLTLRRAAFGDDHADVAQSEMNLANALAELDRHVDALSHAAAAVRIYAALADASPADRRRARLNLANKLHNAGRFADAAATAEQALAEGSGLAPDPRLDAMARFALAQPLWELGGDRDRAVALAADAERTLADDPGLDDELEAIRAWRASHFPLKPQGDP